MKLSFFRGFIPACLFLVFSFANGQDITLPDGSRYYGPVVNGRPHGEGRFVARSGEVYEGTFVNGDFTGEGSLSRPDGLRYRGQFLRWRPHGKGRVVEPQGAIYEGELKEGLYDGQGTLRMPNGEVLAGKFRRGDYFDEKAFLEATIAVETALYSQRRLLDAALAGLQPRQPGRVNAYLLAIAGDGSQEVFRREVEYVKDLFDREFGTRGRSVMLVNSRHTAGTAPMATHTSIREALRAIGKKIDPENDLLFVFVTSHASKEHELKLHQNQMTLRGMRPADLAAALTESGARWRAIVVSACYAGGFMDPLKDERTLVIAASRHDRQSFGCADANDFTYFGRAFFKEALPASGSIEEAFEKASGLVGQWEKRDRQPEASLPQLHSPAPAREHLRRWWSQRQR